MGEFARSSAIAQGAQARWPQAAVLFIVSRRAPYAGSAPFPTALLDSSPTFHSAEVIDIIETWRPDMVIFDNAGRTAQLRAARRAGARVVYISARRRQRRKAFRLSWMRLIDEHWIAYPQFLAGALRPLERLKLAVLHRPQVRYLDVILAGGAARSGRAAGAGYVLVIPGGGTGHPGARDAVAQFLAAARALAASGIETCFVGRPEPPLADAAAADAAAADAAAANAAAANAAADGSRLHMQGLLPQGELAGLMRGARLIVANGGSTLLQGLACGAPCVAVPVAGDQDERIRRCVSAGAAVAAPLAAAAIVRAAIDLLHDEAALNALAGRAAALNLADGVAVAVRAMAALLDPP